MAKMGHFQIEVQQNYWHADAQPVNDPLQMSPPRYLLTISLWIPIELDLDIFNIGGRGTKNAKSQCGTGSEGQWT